MAVRRFQCQHHAVPYVAALRLRVAVTTTESPASQRRRGSPVARTLAGKTPATATFCASRCNTMVTRNPPSAPSTQQLQQGEESLKCLSLAHRAPSHLRRHTPHSLLSGHCLVPPRIVELALLMAHVSMRRCCSEHCRTSSWLSTPTQTQLWHQVALHSATGLHQRGVWHRRAGSTCHVNVYTAVCSTSSTAPPKSRNLQHCFSCRTLRDAQSIHAHAPQQYPAHSKNKIQSIYTTLRQRAHEPKVFSSIASSEPAPSFSGSPFTGLCQAPDSPGTLAAPSFAKQAANVLASVGRRAHGNMAMT
ncbi:hypothetical protein AC578_3873 [Pseudocercospora eumusae]|uniref:Uncharacterized protein n=1 Tax=Pseudocercospora eumusae TaxID=321146 RepID=A0A139H1E8_9PEZI|nr:hypothetical protein AC578_3873 [Pseudocercospora eumusae]